MSAAATIPAPPLDGLTCPLTPVVFVDGVPEPRLRVVRYRAVAPSDRREVTCEVLLDAGEDAALERWLRGRVVATIPVRLQGGEGRWQVLAWGTLRLVTQRVQIGLLHLTLELRDEWVRLLEQMPAYGWWEESGSIVTRPIHGARLVAGASGNRSPVTWPVAGRSVHVLAQQGGAWTVGEALDTLAALMGWELGTDLLPAAVAGEPLLQSVALDQACGAVLDALLTGHGLVMQRELQWVQGTVREQRMVRPRELGRRVGVLPEPSTAVTEVRAGHTGLGGEWTRLAASTAAPAAQPWVAQAQGWVVESTFTLMPGWDRSREGQPDGTYSPATQSDFAPYADVYRWWVLNEDGRYTGAPFGNAAGFALNGVFGQVGVADVPAQPLRFLACVTTESSGTARAPVVEVSLDSGVTWATYPGMVQLATERAAVRFSDVTLPAQVLAAGQGGSLRVRITASLRCPLPTQVTRWRGDPFRPVRPPHVVDAGLAFAFRKVLPGSIHHASLAAGTLTADEINQTPALWAWLVAQMQRRTAGEDADTATFRGHWVGAQPWFRPGDRWSVAPSTSRPDVPQVGGAARYMYLIRLTCDWPSTSAATDGHTRHDGPTTELVLQT